MLRSDTEPNEFTFATVLTSCTGVLGFELGRQIHSLIIKRNYESHIFVGSSLLDMYAKAGGIHEAQGIFECLPERDVVSCTAIISGYAQLGLDEEALELFRRFQREGMSSNYVTYARYMLVTAAGDYGKAIPCSKTNLPITAPVVYQLYFTLIQQAIQAQKDQLQGGGLIMRYICLEASGLTRCLMACFTTSQSQLFSFLFRGWLQLVENFRYSGLEKLEELKI
ncbi:hypothetical protein OIU84_026431 [Salix udensis]|uniref:Pentatricopeptide repeat-containing protein n=1 Tax=Salix udensis TaxID=889485 RepID=A0AAD6KLZ7_9ROSI|nr:hypothetical protein OIU84_026431 [Salix udensis]